MADVSVIIPAHAAAPFIKDAVDSVLAQTTGAREIIVIDDGSPDRSRLEEALEPYGGGIIYRTQEMQGPGAARNTGIQVSSCEYLAFLDADDAWEPEFLESQIRLLESEDADLVYCDARLFGERPLPGSTFMEANPSCGPATLNTLVSGDCVVLTSTVLARRLPLVELGGFNERFQRCEDFELWLRLAAGGGRIAYQQRVLARHRKHSGSLSAATYAMLAALVEVLTILRETPGLRDDTLELIDSRIAHFEALADIDGGKRMLLARRYQEARVRFKKANEVLDSRKLRTVLWGLTIAPGLVRRIYVDRRPGRLVSFE